MQMKSTRLWYAPKKKLQHVHVKQKTAVPTQSNMKAMMRVAIIDVDTTMMRRQKRSANTKQRPPTGKREEEWKNENCS